MCLLPPDIKRFDHCHREAADHPEGSCWPCSHGNGPLPVQPHPLHCALWYRPAHLWLTGWFLSVGDVCLTFFTFVLIFKFVNMFLLFSYYILMLYRYAFFLLWVHMTLFFKPNKIINIAPTLLCDIERDISRQMDMKVSDKTISGWLSILVLSPPLCSWAQWELQTHGPGTGRKLEDPQLQADHVHAHNSPLRHQETLCMIPMHI